MTNNAYYLAFIIELQNHMPMILKSSTSLKVFQFQRQRSVIKYGKIIDN